MGVKTMETTENTEPRAEVKVKELLARVQALQEELKRIKSAQPSEAGRLQNEILNCMEALSKNLAEAPPAEAARIASSIANLTSLMARLTAMPV